MGWQRNWQYVADDAGYRTKTRKPPRERKPAERGKSERKEVLEGPRTPAWACSACNVRGGNFACRITCRECGKAAPKEVKEAAEAAHKRAQAAKDTVAKGGGDAIALLAQAHSAFGHMGLDASDLEENFLQLAVKLREQNRASKPIATQVSLLQQKLKEKGATVQRTTENRDWQVEEIKRMQKTLEETNKALDERLAEEKKLKEDLAKAEEKARTELPPLPKAIAESPHVEKFTSDKRVVKVLGEVHRQQKEQQERHRSWVEELRAYHKEAFGDDAGDEDPFADWLGGTGLPLDPPSALARRVRTRRRPEAKADADGNDSLSDGDEEGAAAPPASKKRRAPSLNDLQSLRAAATDADTTLDAVMGDSEDKQNALVQAWQQKCG